MVETLAQLKLNEVEHEKPIPINEEESKDADGVDTECAICYTVMVEPVTLECNHSFCRICLKTFFQQKIECPMCRAVPSEKFQLLVDPVLQKQIKWVNPEEFEFQ